MTNGNDDRGAAPLVLLDEDAEPGAVEPQGAEPEKSENRGEDPDPRGGRLPRPLLIEVW